uniref:EGF-like domain-containing protein n=1 Tax=Mola mola TaxID=94237 RepID=A0A3Q3XLM8_MOLML
ELSPNGAVDVDECAPPSAPCMHHCTNTVGSYYCHCRDGFTLEGSTACLATDPVALTFDVARGRYYWADGKGNIYRSDGQQSSTVYTG